MMLRLLIALGLALLPAGAQAQPVGPPALYCNSIFAQSAVGGPLAQTRIIQAVAGKAISVCGWNIANTGGSSATVTFQTGTGTNCGTGTAQTGLGVTVPNGQSNIDHIPTVFESGAVNTDLCWTITGTGTINATIYYGQF
jgi:hypothetical protein